MNQQRWTAVLGSAIAVLASSHPAYGALLKPDPVAGSTTMAMIVPPPPDPLQPKGSRGDKVYAIAPSEIEGLNVIWRDRPLLIWEGAIALIEIIDAETDELLWSQLVSPENRCVAYTGQPLQPGRSYEWRLCDQFDAVAHLVSFRVLEAEDRERIAAELAAIEAAAKTGGATPEDIALQRAAYFAEQELWADLLQEAFFVENASTDLMMLRQMLTS